MGNAVARLHHGDALHRDHRPDGPPPVQLACRTVRRFRLRVHAAQYPLGAECVLPDAMSAHVDANHLVVLRDNQSSSAAPLLSDRSFGRVLPDLSFLGRKRLSSARFFHCVDRCSLGRMVVVKRVSPVPMRLLHGCRDRRSVLLADDRQHPLSFSRLGAFECCRPVALFPDAGIYSNVLY